MTTKLAETAPIAAPSPEDAATLATLAKLFNIDDPTDATRIKDAVLAFLDPLVQSRAAVMSKLSATEREMCRRMKIHPAAYAKTRAIVARRVR
jgi:hypothetical protein